MDWPHETIEEQDADSFVPPFCPNEKCDHHRVEEDGDFPWSHHGSYIRKSDQAEIPRYQCHGCQRTFSKQTFACTYWLKRRDLLPRIGAQIVAGSCLRQIGRTVECAPDTAERHIGRLGRHAMLLLASLIEYLHKSGGLEGRFCYDHFETFAIEQLLPLAIGTLIHAETKLVVSIDGAQHARGGTKTAEQKKQWEEILKRFGPPPRGAYTLATRDMLTRLVQVGTAEITLDTDDHKSYPVALKRFAQRERIVHRAFRNPTKAERDAKSEVALQRDAALAPADPFHELWRHSHAHDRRETIAFARRHNAALERAFVIAAWRNWIKRRDEANVNSTTPAQAAGIDAERWTWKRLIAQRLFPGRVSVPESWMDIYRRLISWPGFKRWRRHELKYAF